MGFSQNHVRTIYTVKERGLESLVVAHSSPKIAHTFCDCALTQN